MKRIVSFLLILCSFLSADIQTGLVAHWPLDGSVQEISHDSLNGVITGDITWIADSIFGTVASFDPGDYITIPANSNDISLNIYDVLTVSCFVRNPNGSDWESFVSKNGENGEGWMIRQHSNSGKGTFTLRGTTGDDDPVGKTTITDGQWHHIAGVYDSYAGKRYLYVDGRLDLAIEDSSEITPTAQPVVIGRTPASWANYFSGEMAQIKIYDRALSSLEIAELYFNHMNKPFCMEAPQYDLNNDCQINLFDLSMIASDWLACGAYPDCSELLNYYEGLESGYITVHANQIYNHVSHLTTGACLEDVNHEVYGGIYSQMIFGESFEEPASSTPIENFIFEGLGFAQYKSSANWMVNNGELIAPAADGPKLLLQDTVLDNGFIQSEIYFDNRSFGIVGFIISVTDSWPGADNFNGYEIGLDPATNEVVLGKHSHDWQPISRVSCSVAINTWVTLKAELSGSRIKVYVNGNLYIDYTDPSPLSVGQVGFRSWQRQAKFRNFQINNGGLTRNVPFEYAIEPSALGQISHMWSAFRTLNAKGSYEIETGINFNGSQSQKITFESGSGRIGISNSGLNRRGMAFESGKDYEGFLWAYTASQVSLLLSLEDQSGQNIYGQGRVNISAGSWQKIEFDLISSGQDTNGRFTISLDSPGYVVLGYCFLQPGQWGRFNDLPVRLDVAQALIDQGITILRYGGCMANAAQYRWKNMIGTADQRPPYEGWWYKYSSNGWGIIDFMNFCEAAGFEYVPDFNIEETDADMADFLEYAKGDAATEWGSKRVADGHPEPYNLKYLQFGNEESIDAHYLDRFREVSQAIWANDPDIILIVGDFAYNDIIDDPYNFSGAPRITSLATHQTILNLAKAADRPVWFDVHIWNDNPRDPDYIHKGIPGMKSFVDSLADMANGAEFKVCIFEENANNHTLSRGLGHAHAINEIQRYEHEMPILSAANCLQPNMQNDNGWDQGLLFLDQSKAWGQSSYYVTQMVSGSYQPICVHSTVTSFNDSLDVTACKSENGRILSLRVVNMDQWDIQTKIKLTDYLPTSSKVFVKQIKGSLDQRNTAINPDNIIPSESEIDIEVGNDIFNYIFPAYSYTVMDFE